MVSVKKEDDEVLTLNLVKSDSNVKIESSFVPDFTQRPNFSPEEVYISAGDTPLLTPPNPMTRIDYSEDNLRVNNNGGALGITASRTRQLIFPSSISQTDNFSLPDSLNDIIGQPNSIKRQLVDGLESNDLRSYLANEDNSSIFGTKLSQNIAANPSISRVQVSQLPGDFILYSGNSIDSDQRNNGISHRKKQDTATTLLSPPSPPIEEIVLNSMTSKCFTKRGSRHRTDAEKAIWKRVRNTEAARRSRARKAEKMSQLEESCRRLQTRNESLEMEVSHLRLVLASQLHGDNDGALDG